MDEGTWRAKVHGITEESDTTEYTQHSAVRREHLSVAYVFMYKVIQTQWHHPWREEF